MVRLGDDFNCHRLRQKRNNNINLFKSDFSRFRRCHRRNLNRSSKICRACLRRWARLIASKILWLWSNPTNGDRPISGVSCSTRLPLIMTAAKTGVFLGVWRFHQKLKGSLPTTLRALWLVGGILRCSVIGQQYILPCYWLCCNMLSSMLLSMLSSI